MRCWNFAFGSYLGLACFFVACGGKTPLGDVDAGEPRQVPQPSDEVCNRLDDDLDGQVDEVFRDAQGRYTAFEHCGVCGASCEAAGKAACGVVGEVARCVDTACEPGFALARDGHCVPAWDYLCLRCEDHADCGLAASANCESVGGEQVCTVGCDATAPEGYTCVDGRVIAAAGSCRCTAEQDFALACALEDPDGNTCAGRSQCTAGVLTACEPLEDVCDGLDNDCDGTADEAFVDARGAYFVDPRHCGRCGVDCREDGLQELVCGGDPFAPHCVLDCPDARDGLDPEDMIDADGDLTNGCECRWLSAGDEAGPLPTAGNERPLDTNCDGADGVVVESFYVSPDGDDAAPGSPTRPFRTITRGFEAAGASLSEASPRPHVFIASGTYVETPVLTPGIQVHGGYRRDFRALDPAGYRTEIRAPVDATTVGRAALVVDDTGGSGTVTLFEGIVVIGADAQSPGEPAFGLFSRGAGSGRVVLRNLEVYAGVGGDGIAGVAGGSGSSPGAAGASGLDPRAAIEDGSNRCIFANTQNTVQGGAGAAHMCGSSSTAGGEGGDSRCPERFNRQMRGSAGSGGAAGGTGGNDLFGPIVDRGYGCPGDICCGLADFEVPTDFQGPGDGEHGRPGTPGRDGDGCGDPLGRLSASGWSGASARAGSDGSRGAGGGGGGAGGGVVMDYYEGFCEYSDGLGGGGGGGGAGGCGGAAGRAGSSGGPSIAVVMFGNPITLEQSAVVPSTGGRGGDGGPGGAGGAGSEGGQGGFTPREDQITPTLAGAYPGGRGGNGGDGGDGGGGGGGCGGSSVGVWAVVRNDPAGLAARLQADNRFVAPQAGEGGRGGGGALSSRGRDGVAEAVYTEAQ